MYWLSDPTSKLWHSQLRGWSSRAAFDILIVLQKCFWNGYCWVLVFVKKKVIINNKSKTSLLYLTQQQDLLWNVIGIHKRWYVIFFNQYCALQDRHRIRNRLADKLLSLKQHLTDFVCNTQLPYDYIWYLFFSDVIYFFNVSYTLPMVFGLALRLPFSFVVYYLLLFLLYRLELRSLLGLLGILLWGSNLAKRLRSINIYPATGLPCRPTSSTYALDY